MKILLVFFLMLSSLSFAQEIKVLSWNVFMLPRPIKFSLQAERTPLIISEMLKSNADIIFLQEAFQNKFQKEVLKKTKQQYPHQFYLGRESGSFTVYGSGVYLLSRYPFKILNKVYFDDCTGADCFASKGTFLAEFTIPDGPKIQFAPTHMQAGGKNSAIRLKQLSDINSILSINAQNGVPQILIGDLNIDALEGDEFKTALDFMHMNSTPLEGEPGYTNGFPTICYTKPGDDHKELIDHIWLKPLISTAKVYHQKVRPFSGKLDGKECPLSDHYAVEAIIKL